MAITPELRQRVLITLGLAPDPAAAPVTIEEDEAVQRRRREHESAAALHRTMRARQLRDLERRPRRRPPEDEEDEEEPLHPERIGAGSERVNDELINMLAIVAHRRFCHEHGHHKGCKRCETNEHGFFLRCQICKDEMVHPKRGSHAALNALARSLTGLW